MHAAARSRPRSAALQARIAQVAAPGAVGGVETVLTELLSAAAFTGSPALCLALIPPGGAVPKAFEQLAVRGIQTVRVSAPHRKYIAHYRALVSALREHGATVAHSHGYHADVLTRFAARTLGIPHVSTLHGFVGATTRGRLYEALQLRALRSASAVIAVSDAIRDRAVRSGIPRARVHVIPNAAPESVLVSRDEARRVLGLESHSRVLGWVGRMSAEKDPEAFVRLVSAMASRDAEDVGIMMGDGPLMTNVRSRGEQLVQDKVLRLPGIVKNAGTLVAALDALVVTSSTEGTPMVILEAMRAGVPVVSTEVGGVPHMLGEQCGLLVPYGNDNALLAAAQQVLHDPAFAQVLRDNASRRVAERYNRSAWWTQHQSLYESLR